MTSRWLAVLCLGFLMAGCAINRGEVDVRVPETANPEAAVLVKIVGVSDDRVFEIDPPAPSTPSLKNDEIHDQGITARAMARKRNTYGAAFGDILLPAGRTVAQLTEEALAKALTDAGYGVVSEGQPGYAGARALTSQIKEFWAWMTPGFWEIALEHKSLLVLEGDWPVDEKNREVKGYARVTGVAATTGLWEEVFAAGLANLIESVKRVLKKPSDQISHAVPAPVS